MPHFDTVHVYLGPRSYDIVIGSNILLESGHYISNIIGNRDVCIITDQNIANAGHLETLTKSLTAYGVHVIDSNILPPGEGTKSYSHFEQVLEWLFERNIDRDTVLIALGGGVIGDLTGFVASVALRGIDFIQIPTTLLAMVDSSVGGKTGINSPQGKNLIGAFHQPLMVLVDISTLDTLDERQIRSGYAEIIKYGLINDKDFFKWLEIYGEKLLKGDEFIRMHSVVVSCKSKAAIVGRDEQERGDRALLNFGHTFGHAFETICNYDGRILHGEAVALGMVLAYQLSNRLNLVSTDDVKRIEKHIHDAGLPVCSTDIPLVAWHSDELIKCMLNDKKNKNGKITFILTRGIGHTFIENNVDLKMVESIL